MMAIPHTGDTWNIVVSNAMIRREFVDGDDDVAVSYAVTHRGIPYTSGSLVWDNPDTEIEDAWSAEFTLPPTPGICVVVVTVESDEVIGTRQHSIKVT
jgi:hypothetical protein